MINTAPPASNSVFQIFGRLKNGFDITKLIFQLTRLTVVQWSRTLFSVSLYLFFSVWSFNCFLTLFFLSARFRLFLLLTLLIMHIDQYIFYAQVRSFILEKEFQDQSRALDLHTGQTYSQKKP